MPRPLQKIPLSSPNCRRREAFTLVELLIVIGILGMLVAILLPALRKARLAAEQTVCASQLHQIGMGLLMYVNENRGRLPMVVEPMWQPDGTLDFSVDPFDASKYPRSLANVMHPYLKGAAVFNCPSAVLGYPQPAFRMSYRVSSANNYDGQIRSEDQLVNRDGTTQYAYSLKYLNGRKYRMIHVDSRSFPFRLASGPGPYYLIRDFVSRGRNGMFFAPHRGSFNQLKLDLSISFEKETDVGLTYP